MGSDPFRFAGGLGSPPMRSGRQGATIGAPPRVPPPQEPTLLITPRPDADVETLRARLHGSVHVPGDPGWDRARRAWNLVADQQPAAVAVPLTDADVAAVVRHAAATGLPVAPQGTGHGAAAPRPLDDAILLNHS